MKKLHAKSSCCKARIINFGHRRRQCVKCRKTWRIRRKRRGRKRSRGNIDLLQRFFDHVIGSSRARASHANQSARTLQRKLVHSRDLFCRTSPWPILPNTYPLILIADGMVKYIDKRWHTMYFMFIRRPEEKHASIVQPVILPGVESQLSWRRALNSLPIEILDNIQAIVCDGHRGLVNYAKHHHWLIQRCHFHLIASIQGRRSRWKNSRHRKEGELIYKLTKKALEASVETDINQILIKIDNLALSTSSSELKRVLMGFANNADDYRTYLYHSNLHLPTTSNSAESFIGCVKELLHRMRGASSIQSLEKWTEALAKYKKIILCNGARQPKN